MKSHAHEWQPHIMPTCFSSVAADASNSAGASTRNARSSSDKDAMQQ